MHPAAPHLLPLGPARGDPGDHAPSARTRAALVTACISAAAWLLACGPPAPAAGPLIELRKHDLDRAYGGNGRPGWVRAADLDGDGDLDVMAGGGEALFAYENRGGARSWRRHGSLDPTREMGANGAVLQDVDADGDPDVIAARFYGDLGWWENPGAPLATRPWPFHPIGPESWFLHDLLAADLDGDGGPPELIANFLSRGMEAEVRIRIYRPGPDPQLPWPSQLLEPGRDDGENNHAGLDVGDIDGDGRLDLAYSNGWYQAPPAHGAPWVWHPVTDLYGISNTLLRDLDGDGRLEMIVAAGHHGRGVYHLVPGESGSTAWRREAIDAELLHPECLASADLDGDGDLDLVTCELDFERWSDPVHALHVLENLGAGRRWRRHTPLPYTDPAHLLQLVDLNGDGRLDVLAEATGAPVVSYYENLGPRQERKK